MFFTCWIPDFRPRLLSRKMQTMGGAASDTVATTAKRWAVIKF